MKTCAICGKRYPTDDTHYFTMHSDQMRICVFCLVDAARNLVYQRIEDLHRLERWMDEWRLLYQRESGAGSEAGHDAG